VRHGGLLLLLLLLSIHHCHRHHAWEGQGVGMRR
jgi:hypothetical protein